MSSKELQIAGIDDEFIERIEDAGDAETNALAIVSAVNSTWGAEINPEAVPYMLAALKKVLKYFDDDHLYTDSPTPKAVFEAINKAKIV